MRHLWTYLVSPVLMRLSLTTWNINSVRLRIDLVARFIKSVRPDILCLQETKCIDDAFPLKRFKRLGYEHVALNGQKGYHGVAIVSRLPFENTDIRTFCEKLDSRHISV
jgi:exodeoxyribonuclease-3